MLSLGAVGNDLMEIAPRAKMYRLYCAIWDRAPPSALTRNISQLLVMTLGAVKAAPFPSVSPVFA